MIIYKKELFISFFKVTTAASKESSTMHYYAESSTFFGSQSQFCFYPGVELIGGDIGNAVTTTPEVGRKIN